MKLSSIRYLFNQGVKSIFTHGVMSFASFCILMVSLLLVGASVLFSMNVNNVVGSVENRNEVTLFLVDDITQQRTDELQAKLEAMENVSSISFYSKETALEEYQSQLENYAELFEYLDENPLPDSFRVRVSDVSLINQTVEQFSSLKDVYSVKAPFDFANVLTELKDIFTTISLMLITALTIVSMIIISNTTRTSAQMRKTEIHIMKYVGASPAFIRFPFFVEGMFIGAAAGIVASLLTWACYDALLDSLTQDMYIWNILGVTSFIDFSSIKFYVIIAYLVIGAAIGAIGSMLSTRKFVQA